MSMNFSLSLKSAHSRNISNIDTDLVLEAVERKREPFSRVSTEMEHYRLARVVPEGLEIGDQEKIMHCDVGSGSGIKKMYHI